MGTRRREAGGMGAIAEARGWKKIGQKLVGVSSAG